MTRLRCALLALAALALCCTSARADFYDLSEEELTYEFPSPRRVIAMYNLEDSPTLLGAAKTQPFIQLDLKFSTYVPSQRPPNQDSEPLAHSPRFQTLADATATIAKEDVVAEVKDGLTHIKPTKATDDEAADALKAKAAENADAPVLPGGTTSETVTPEQAAATRAADAAKEKAAENGDQPAAPELRTAKRTAHPHIQVLILQDTSLEQIGYAEPGSTYTKYCCTPTLFAQGVEGCNEIDSLIVKGERVHKLMSAFFIDGSTQARLEGPDARYDITETGEHILLISNCDSRLSQLNTQVSGGGIWKNPFGYLPGRLFGFLPFYFGMLVIYIAFTCTWVILNLIHRKDVSAIQHCISIALVLTTVEVMAWFVDYWRFNESGMRHMGGVIAAILVSVLRLTVSRMLVVSVSIGYPVVRPSLALSTKVKIGLLGIVYFACEAALEVVTRYAQMNGTAERWRIFLSIPVAILNAIFYWWIFTALHDLLSYLEQQNQAIKLVMYRTFTHVLAASLVAAVMFALFQIYFMMTSQMAIHWSLLWLLDGGFQLILYTVIFICMSWLWRPSSDSRRYAYAELSNQGGTGTALGGMDEDEEFGEVEMGEHGVHAAAVNVDNAKFTVEDD